MSDPHDRDYYRRAGWFERTAATVLGLVLGTVVGAVRLVQRLKR